MSKLSPLTVEITEPASNGHTSTKTFIFKRDEGPRADTSLEALARLKPAFKEGGTVTAGTSSQMSDGAAGVIVMSQVKGSRHWVLSRWRALSLLQLLACPPELMGIGPIAAIPKALNWPGCP